MKIIEKEILAQTPDTKIIRFKIHAPLIVSKTQPGQFIVVMAAEKGERIPLTVVDKDENSGTLTLIVQEAGFSTRLLGGLGAGDSLYAIVGPLGHPTEIKNYGRVMLVGGGVGIAEIYPLAKALKDKGNPLTTILGARTKGLLILEDELRAASDELHITTDDGSYGRRGFVTDALRELLAHTLHPIPRQARDPSPRDPEQSRRAPYTLVYVVGPIPMMKKVAEVTREFGVKTTVSLNPLMVDATGMCGGCRVKIGDEVKFSCVDGPEFDAHLVDWEELARRIGVYSDKEKHICRLNEHIT